jgi:DNA-binding transcriptional LysR family regulator
MNNHLAALRLFVRVARTGSFSRAAREIDIAQPTASRIIAQLEEEVGAALFTRTTRALSLTEVGAEYLERVEHILSELDEAGHAARRTGELRGTLRVGLSSSLAIRAVIPFLPLFTAAHPALQIELLIDDKRQDLVFDGVDIALRFGAIPDSTAVARLLSTWPRVIVAAPSYLARRGTPSTPDELATHVAVKLHTGMAQEWTLRRGADEAVVRVEGTVRVTANEGAIAAAVVGLGIVATGRVACQKEMLDGSLVRVLPDWQLDDIPLHAVFASGRAAKPAARAFAEFLAQQLREF